MRNLTKLIILSLLLTAGTTTIAQTFGLKAGLNFSNLNIEDNDLDSKLNLGFHIGPTVELPLNETFTFETGLLLTSKGMKNSEEGSYYDYSNNVNLLYVDVPLTAKITQDLGSLKIYGTFGPYIGMGLSGKVKYESTYDGETESDKEDINFGKDEDLKRLDFGATVGAGVVINSILVGLSYDLGLANISTVDEKITSRVIKLSFGYKFGKE